MLLDYVITKLSKNKTTKVGFTYYIITEGEEVSKMLMHDYAGDLGQWGGSWSCDDVNY